MLTLVRSALALCLLVGAAPDGQKVTKEAARAYKEACDHGDMEACERLAEAHWRGEGVPKDKWDKWRAAALFTKACDGGVMAGCFNKGVMLAVGQGGPKDEWRAAVFFKKACAGGVPLGCDQMKKYQWQLSRLDAHRERMKAKLAELGLTNEYDEPARPIQPAKKPPRQGYPEQAFVDCTQGTVFLLYVIDAKGLASDIEVLESVPGLDEAAIKTVRDMRWQPAQKAGTPVATVVEEHRQFFLYECSTSAPFPRR
jgi:TonB family protein